MDKTLRNVLHQIEFAVRTTIEILGTLEEEDLQRRPTDHKFSVGELLGHMALICEADWRISNGATQSEMEGFYSSNSLQSLHTIREALLHNYESLEKNYLSLSEKQLLEETTSYWGRTYSRFEWLLEILTHLFHHRGQLHAMLVHCNKKDPGIQLFE